MTSEFEVRMRTAALEGLRRHPDVGRRASVNSLAGFSAWASGHVAEALVDAWCHDDIDLMAPDISAFYAPFEKPVEGASLIEPVLAGTERAGPPRGRRLYRSPLDRVIQETCEQVYALER